MLELRLVDQCYADRNVNKYNITGAVILYDMRPVRQEERNIPGLIPYKVVRKLYKAVRIYNSEEIGLDQTRQRLDRANKNVVMTTSWKSTFLTVRGLGLCIRVRHSRASEARERVPVLTVGVVVSGIDCILRTKISSGVSIHGERLPMPSFKIMRDSKQGARGRRTKCQSLDEQKKPS